MKKVSHNSLQLLTTLTAIALAVQANTASAAPITWSSATNTTNKTQLLEGNVVSAVNGGSAVSISNAGPRGTNTYRFSGGGFNSIDLAPSTNANTFTEAGSRSTGDAGFDQLINSFSYANGAETAVHTIRGLTRGVQYRVQVFFNDQRADFSSRRMGLSDNRNSAQQVQIQANGRGWGQHAVGTFVADSTTQAIRYTANGFGNIHLTAVLVVADQQPSAPTSNMYGDTTVSTETFTSYITFSEEVRGLAANDFSVENGEIVSVEGSGRYYTVTVLAANPGEVDITLNENAVTSTANGMANSQSQSRTVQNNASFLDAWVVDDQSDWLAARQTSNMNIANGFAQSNSNNASFSSVVRSFDTPRRAVNFTLSQSTDWNNWIPVSNVGPSDARDAPVLVSVEDNNYYFLALGAGDSYSAWHSTNMRNWTLRGPVVPEGDGRWVTSAEYKDGEFFIYADVPNDQDPTLFIDSNLDDGRPGRSMGPAFTKENCGSDASFFRNDTDGGLFHIIYEDWGPINARQNSYDSPLAGHSTSVDGLTGFVDHEHQPPVDHRTNPTGEIASYQHPFIGTCEYEVHTPAQDAYGDWTTIKVGDQYYMFSDFDSHDAGISVGRFTSDSIYGEFDLIGSLGNGHPDPTVGFAEGQFYLITQQNTDYVSPGPWVDGVEARVGVDTTGDQRINVWTDWQTVTERYDHTAGFIRVVEKTPATVNVSSLPAGVGFQYQIRTDNSVVARATPVLDSVEMRFNTTTDDNASGTPTTETPAPATGTPDTGTPDTRVVQIKKRNAQGFAIDSSNGAAPDQNVHLWTDNRDSVNQQWLEVSRGNDFYTYQKPGTNFCLDGGAGGANRQNVRLWRCNANSQNQHWQKVSTDSGFFQLRKRNAPGFAINGGGGGVESQNVNLFKSSSASHNLQWSID